MEPILDDPPSHSIIASIDTVLDIINSKLLLKKKEIDYDITLREMKLEARQRIALKKLQDTIQANYLKEGIADV